MLPSPSTDSTSIRPAMTPARPRLSASPMPVPSIADCSAPSRSNGSKSRSRSSGCRPGPVSATRIATVSRSRASQSTSTLPPARLYLMPLLTRLTSTCTTRCRSANTCAPSSQWAHSLRRTVIPAASAWLRTRSSASSTASATATGSSETVSVPESIRETSSTSLTSPSRCRPPVRICVTNSRWSGGEVVELEQLGEPEDGVERRAQLVAHPGEERGLGPVGVECLVAGPLVALGEVVRLAFRGLERLERVHPVGDLTGRHAQPVAHPHGAQVEDPLLLARRGHGPPAVDGERLAGLDGVRVRREQRLPVLGRESGEDVAADRCGAVAPQEVEGRLVAVGDDDVDDPSRVVAHGIQEDVHVGLGVERGAELLLGAAQRLLGEVLVLGVPPRRDPPGRVCRRRRAPASPGSSPTGRHPPSTGSAAPSRRAGRRPAAPGWPASRGRSSGCTKSAHGWPSNSDGSHPVTRVTASLIHCTTPSLPVEGHDVARVLRQQLQPVAEPHVLGHVDDLGDEVLDPAVGVAHADDRQVAVHHRAVGSQVALREPVAVARAVEDLVDEGGVDREVVGVGQLLPGRRPQGRPRRGRASRRRPG